MILKQRLDIFCLLSKRRYIRVTDVMTLNAFVIITELRMTSKQYLNDDDAEFTLKALRPIDVTTWSSNVMYGRNVCRR